MLRLKLIQVSKGVGGGYGVALYYKGLIIERQLWWIVICADIHSITKYQCIFYCCIFSRLYTVNDSVVTDTNSRCNCLGFICNACFSGHTHLWQKLQMNGTNKHLTHNDRKQIHKEGKYQITLIFIYRAIPHMACILYVCSLSTTKYDITHTKIIHWFSDSTSTTVRLGFSNRNHCTRVYSNNDCNDIVNWNLQDCVALSISMSPETLWGGRPG